MEKVFVVEYCDNGVNYAYRDLDRARKDVLKHYFEEVFPRLHDIDATNSGSDDYTVAEQIRDDMLGLFSDSAYVQDYAYIYPIEVRD